jgi:hypothetical protein
MAIVVVATEAGEEVASTAVVSMGAAEVTNRTLVSTREMLRRLMLLLTTMLGGSEQKM